MSHSLTWTHDNPPSWDRQKIDLLGKIPRGIFDLGELAEGDLVPGEWWRVEDGGKVVGYGWMECTWGDAEILLAVDPDQRKHGVGTFILNNLETEAQTRGLNYLYNVVQPTHPDPEGITHWLNARRFEAAHDRLRRRIPQRRPD